MVDPMYRMVRPARTAWRYSASGSPCAHAPRCRPTSVGHRASGAHEVEVHGEDLIILRERDVHAVAAERIEESTGLYL